ncbi:MAG: HNH endonuclease [Clostridiales bacterium]|nr:HNH endonuclease [Clostridiales bacterium]
MIKYKTVVVSIGLNFNETIDDKKFWHNSTQYEKGKCGKFCRLVLIGEFYSEKLSLSFLLKNGLLCAPQRPQKICLQLENYIKSVLNENDDILLDNAVEQFEEGRQKLKQHIVRERNPGLVQAAKQKFQQEHNGKLYCEICGFDFFEVYGDIGKDYIEAHHKKPISTMKDGEQTSIEDMAIVCSNCHRIIHRKKPWLTIEELKNLLHKNK